METAAMFDAAVETLMPSGGENGTQAMLGLASPPAARKDALALLADRLDLLVADGDADGLARAPLDKLVGVAMDQVAPNGVLCPGYVLGKLAQVVVAAVKARAALQGPEAFVDGLFASLLLPALKTDEPAMVAFFLVACKEMHQAIIDNDIRRSNPDAALCSAILKHMRESGLAAALVDAILHIADAHGHDSSLVALALEVLAEVTAWVDAHLVVTDEVLSLLYAQLLSTPRGATAQAIDALEELVSKGMPPAEKLALIQSLALPALLDGMALSPHTPPDSHEFDVVVALAGLVKACVLTLCSSWFKMVRDEANLATDDDHLTASYLRDAIFECLQISLAFAAADAPEIVAHTVAGATDFVSRFKRAAASGPITASLILDGNMASLLVALLELVSIKSRLPPGYTPHDPENTHSGPCLSILVDESSIEAFRASLLSLFKNAAGLSPMLTMAWLRTALQAGLCDPDRAIVAEPLVGMFYALGHVLQVEFASAVAGEATPGIGRHAQLPTLDGIIAAAENTRHGLALGDAGDVGAVFLIDTFLDIIDADLLADDDLALKRAMYEVLARYCPLLSHAGNSVAPVFLSLLDKGGIQCGHPSLVPRFGALVVKLATELTHQLAAHLDVILNTVLLLLVPSSIDEVSPAAPAVAEAVGILLVHNESSLSDDARHSVLDHLLDGLCSLIESVVGNASNGALSSDDAADVVTHFVFVAASLSKAITAASGLGHHFMSAYERILSAVWQLGMLTPPLTSKVFSFVHCMVDTLGDGVLSGLNPLATMFLTLPEAYDSDAVTSVALFIGLLNQLVARFKDAVVPVAADILPRAVAAVETAAASSPSGHYGHRAAHGVLSEYDREVDGLTRAALAWLVTMFTHGVAEQVFSVAAASSDDVVALLTTLAAVARPGGTQCRRALFQLARAVTSTWLTPGSSSLAGIDSFVYDTALSLGFSIVLDPAFDMSDARAAFFVVSEVAGLVRAVYSADPDRAAAWLQHHLFENQAHANAFPDFMERLANASDKKWSAYFRRVLNELRS
ncbi:uncharacterized protein AMSG_06812 [Thecamonas trahens ATCC 50062]|uniref:Exportin-T n=1 Tax=Thecamonas trahens ATCC 50062 TaxID=461836 RepID=A0A0L0DDC1_THETB|nr:hypothetical protein AMSG_06812 [Thecamonas trahens ATCC 50062]KNC50329.1 hypothetical protein AMSG_06812 [Thecamonas trahens ATCC 50062]|eukprot:XP_013756875.1 hypothetical protein AMSG_06812 [Thecamonas trahens ATCC 50062]